MSFFRNIENIGISKKEFLQLCISVLLLLLAVILPVEEGVKNALYVISFVIASYDLIISSFQLLFAEHKLGEELLFCIASLMCFVVSAWIDGALLILIYRFFNLLQKIIKTQYEKNIRQRLSSNLGTYLCIKNNEHINVTADEIQPGDVLELAAGDYVPVDCTVLDGKGRVELSPIVGIEHHMSTEPGRQIFGGAYVENGSITVTCDGTVSETARYKAFKIASSDDSWKNSIEEKLEKYSYFYAPFALGFCILFSLLLLIISDVTTEQAIHRALILLAVSSPTVLAFPLPFFNKAARISSLAHGVLVRDSKTMSNLSNASAVILDKEELLVTGQYKLVRVDSDKLDPDLLLKVAAHACKDSTLPEEVAICRAYSGETDMRLVDKFAEYDGGVAAIINGVQVVIGKKQFLEQANVEIEERQEEYAVYMSFNGQYAGCFILSDIIREEAKGTVKAIESTGCKCLMLSSGGAESTERAAKAVGICEFHSLCMPLDRIEKIQYIKEKYYPGKVIVIGHGGSDDSCLAAADVGATVCGLTSNMAFHSGNAVIFDAMPDAIAFAVNIGRNMKARIKKYVSVHLLIKLIMLLITLLGIYPFLWSAVAADCVCSIVGLYFADIKKSKDK